MFAVDAYVGKTGVDCIELGPRPAGVPGPAIVRGIRDAAGDGVDNPPTGGIEEVDCKEL